MTVFWAGLAIFFFMVISYPLRRINRRHPKLNQVLFAAESAISKLVINLTRSVRIDICHLEDQAFLRGLTLIGAVSVFQMAFSYLTPEEREYQEIEKVANKIERLIEKAMLNAENQNSQSGLQACQELWNYFELLKSNLRKKKIDLADFLAEVEEIEIDAKKLCEMQFPTNETHEEAGLEHENLYQVLWLTPSATDQEIKDAYKQLCKVFHPDITKLDKKEAEKQLIKINEAYSVLSNPEKRAEYDKTIRKGD